VYFGKRGLQNVEPGIAAMRVFAEMASEELAAWLTMKQAQNMPSEMLQCNTFGQTIFHIGIEPFEHVAAGTLALHSAKQSRVYLVEQPWIVISLTTQHHTVHVLKMHLAFVECTYAPIYHNLLVREQALDCMHASIIQRRNLAIFLRTQTLQQRNPRMNDERA